MTDKKDPKTVESKEFIQNSTTNLLIKNSTFEKGYVNDTLFNIYEEKKTSKFYLL